MQLRSAIGIGPNTVAALCGDGDRLELALNLVRELQAAGLRVVYTTALAMPLPRLETVLMNRPMALATVLSFLEAGTPCCVGGSLLADGTLNAPDQEVLFTLVQAADVVLIDCDAAHIPELANVVVPVGNTAGAEQFDRGELPEQFPGPLSGVRVVPVVIQPDAGGPCNPAAEKFLRMGAGRAVLAANASPAGGEATPAEYRVKTVLGTIDGLVLAAGSARRWGAGHKLLHRLAGKTLLERSLTAPLGADLRQVVVVTGPVHDAMMPILSRYPVHAYNNTGYAGGMSTSLQMGLEILYPPELPPNYIPPAALLIFLADQPGLTAAAVNRLIHTWRQTGAPIVAPEWGGRVRNPVLFSAAMVPELRQIAGDEGGRRVLRAHADQVATVKFNDGDLFRDIDTPADLPPAAAE